MEKEAVVRLDNGISLSHKTEQIWVSWTEVHGPRSCYTEWCKSEREKQTPYIYAYKQNLEKRYRWTYLQARNREAVVEAASIPQTDRIE